MNDQYFSLVTEKKYPNRVKIVCNIKKFGITDYNGDILPARLLGLKYHNWLKFCYQNFNSIIVDDKESLPYPIFYRDISLYKLFHILNLRAKYVVKMQEIKNASNS